MSTNDKMDIDSNNASPDDTTTKNENESSKPSPSEPSVDTSAPLESQTPSQSQSQSESNSPSKTKTKMDDKKRAHLKNKLKERILSNRRIVISGCGNWRCTNPYCKSNEKNLDKTYSEAQASKLALKMVKLKHGDCSTFTEKEVIPLKYSSICDVDENNKTEINDIIVKAFTHWDILQLSFLTTKNVSAEDPAIDFNELDKTFKVILNDDDLRSNAVDALYKSLTSYSNKARPSLLELRSILILIENPLILSEDIDCHYLLEPLLSLISNLGSSDFRSIKIMHKWFANYAELSRLNGILSSLHQYMTLTIEISESTIEDLTDEWRTELKYDDVEDNDERDEIETEIEKRQQIEREKYIKNKISSVIKMIDIVWIANKIIIKHTADIIKKQKEFEKSQQNLMEIDEEETNDKKKNDVDVIDEEKDDEKNNNKNNEKKRRMSFIGLTLLRQPLKLSSFHNDGLNEAICSRGDQRQHIHRRDFIHYKENDFFTYLEFPYILTAASKSRYLEFENLLRQHRARRRRMFDLMLGAGIMQFNRAQLMEELDLVLRVRRSSLISDTLGILQLQESSDLRKRLRIVFDQEQGIDQGGLTKEYFQLIMKELFDPAYGMFVYNENTLNFWFNRDAFLLTGDTKSMLLNYELVGKLVGIAIYNNTILDLRFPRVIFKKLLQNEAINFIDFRDYDPELAKGFEQLLNFTGNVEEIYCRNFVVKYKNVFGQECEYELCSNGKNMTLNNSNREQYVNLYIKYVLEESIEQQFASFLKGFKNVCDSDIFNKFSSEELELLICGSKEFDFDALESSTKYEDGLHRDSRIVREFWDIAHKLSDENKRKLLTFCTGSDRVPINGLGELTLTISKNGNDNTKLPTSHTCFNHLLLPEYDNKETLNKRLLTAIQNSEGFGLL